LENNKIIHIARRFIKEEWGGTETVILETSKQLQRGGYDTEICTTNLLSKKKREDVYGFSVRRFSSFYTYFGMNKSNKNSLDRSGGNVFSFSLFFSLLFVKDVKVFHLHTMGRIGGIVRTISKLRGIPYVVSIHGGYLDISKAQYENMMSRLEGTFDWGKLLGLLVGSRRVLQDADVILCVGKRESELMQQKYPNKKVVYLANGIDFKKFESGDGNSFRKKYGITKVENMLLCVSRISHQKNQTLLVKAFIELIKSNKNLKLVLIGSISDRSHYEEIKDLIRKSSIEDKVLILTVITSQL